jgi:hypothetical protein
MKAPAFAIRGKLTSRKGALVSFSPPQSLKDKGVKRMCGRIIDEVWEDEALTLLECREPAGKDDWGDYAFCSQLIEFENGERLVRLAYYRRQAGEDFWRFASQTTITCAPKSIKKLLEKTLAKDQWFSDC